MKAADPGGSRFADELVRLLGERSPADRRILFVGLLNKHLPGGQRAVLVGGALVEFYTSGLYTTGDVDLIGNWNAIEDVMRQAGFGKEGRHLYREDLGLVVEIPKDSLRRTETVVLHEVEGLPVYAVTVEDAIVDRLLAAKFWKSTTDWEQAILLYAAHRARVDPAVLEQKAAANDVPDTLRRLVSDVAGQGR